jgi:hypothetical protein
MRKPLEELSIKSGGTIEPDINSRFVSKQIHLSVQNGLDANQSAEFQNESVYVEPQTKVMAHACAAGCGHFCWAASTRC